MRVGPVFAAAVAVTMLALSGGSHVPRDRANPAMMVIVADTTDDTRARTGATDPASGTDVTPSAVRRDAEATGAHAATTDAATTDADTDVTPSHVVSSATADGSGVGRVPCSTPPDKIHDRSGAVRRDSAPEAARDHARHVDGPLNDALDDIRDLLRRILSASNAPANPAADAPTDPSSSAEPAPADDSTTTDRTPTTELAPTAGPAPTGSLAPTTAEPDSARPDLPSSILSLGDWYLTLPTGTPGDPDTVENPSLENFTDEFFKLNPTRNGVVFRARGDGVTTKNSHYPRSELREMNGDQKASWTNTSGSHTLDVCEAITQVPTAKPEVVSAQIHDDHDDVLQIRLEGQKLIVQYNDGRSEAVLDPAYTLGTPFHLRIVAADSRVDVSYNGRHTVQLPLSGSGWYWKVGAYVQSNATTGDGAGSGGEVVVYSLTATHDPRSAGPITTVAPSTTTDARPRVHDHGAPR